MQIPPVALEKLKAILEKHPPLDPKTFTYVPMSDKRIAELFPEPQLAAYVRSMRDRFYLGYQEWKRNQKESSEGPEKTEGYAE